MSKLFNLKEWLTLAEAARYLSIVLGEVVTEPDILRLALDGHLKLSVYIVNFTGARHCKYVRWEETEWVITPKPALMPDNFPKPLSPKDFRDRGCPPKFMALWNSIPDHQKNDFYIHQSSISIGSKHYINLSEKERNISGVWDLPMIGNEILEIENEYNKLTGGPTVTDQYLIGTFVEREGGDVYQLLERFEDNQYIVGSLAALENLKKYIDCNNIEAEEADALLNRYWAEDRKKFLAQYKTHGLPQDCVIVVRTKALREFEETLIEPTSKPESTRKTENLLQALTCIAIDAYGYDPKSMKSTAPGEIADALSKLGKSFDQKTIRGWLKEGSDLLPSIPH